MEAMLPYLVEAGAGGPPPRPLKRWPRPGRLITYYDIRDQEPQYPMLETIRKAVPEDAFTIWDVTQFGYYARTHFQVNHPKTYIDSGYSFNLGYGFPTALGVKVAKPERRVVCSPATAGLCSIRRNWPRR